MSESTTGTAKSAATRKKHKELLPLTVALAPYLALFAAAVGLLVATQEGISGSVGYWEGLIPIVALFSIGSGWTQAYVAGRSRFAFLLKQLIHWGLLIAFLYVVNGAGIPEAIGDQKYTIFIVSLLAFGTFVAALHLDAKMLFFSAFLLFCAYFLMVPAGNPALAFLGESVGVADAAAKPMISMGALAVVGFLGTFLVLVSMRGALLARRVRGR